MLMFILLILCFIFIVKTAPRYKDDDPVSEELLDIANMID